jgi:hypothetical protein
MEVMARHIAAIPAGNLRVPRAQFAAVWADAEERDREQGARGVLDWYAGAVAVTCRWLAGAVVHTPSGPRHLARSPVTRRATLAFEELIEAECQAAELLDVRCPDLLMLQPGWCEGVRATLRWAWRHEGPPPLQLPVAPDHGDGQHGSHSVWARS